ncbi:MAG TPA: EAL domain-containing protein, partial [Chroococcidiopsis sp.]
ADGHDAWIDMNKVPIHDDAGQTIGILGTLGDFTDRKQAEDTLAKRDRYLTALVEIHRHMLANGDSEHLYADVTKTLGYASGTDRVELYINSRDSDGNLYMSLKSSWNADGIPPSPSKLHGQISYAQFSPDWLQQMSNGESHSGLVKHLPTADRQFCEAQQMQAILELPIIVNGEFVGFISFDNLHKERNWEPLEVDLLQTAAGAIAIQLERRQTQTALQQTEAKYRSIFENAVEGMFQSTPKGAYITVNPMLARMYGYESPTDLMASMTDIGQQLYVDPHRRYQFAQLMQDCGVVWGFESEVYRKDGSRLWISECARAIYGADGQILYYEGTVEDITRRKTAEAELLNRENLLQGVSQATHCLLTTLNLDQAITEALAILGEAAGVARVCICEHAPHSDTQEPAMTTRYEWVQASIPPTIDQPHWNNQPFSAHGLTRWYAAFQQGHSINSIVRHLPAAERELLSRDQILSVLVVPIFIDDQLWGTIGFDDCHAERQWTASEESILVAIAASLGGAIKRQQTEAQMRYQAFHDALTGLPNRSLFDYRLNRAIGDARRTNDLLGVVFLDLDRFKTINDTLGHAVGDRLLQQATQRLTTCLREEDCIARWGGDEFTLVLPNLKHPDDAATIAQRISDALRPAFRLDHHDLYITSSIGIALYPHNGQDAETLLKNADAALYRAKEQGRNNYQFYSHAINPQASQLLTLDHSLHQALDRNEFIVFYQPQFNVVTGQITQVEALVRWKHPQLGLISPATFITLAEENGLIIPIGEWVLRVACTQTKVWQAFGLPPLRVAVNLSARQFQQPDLVERIAQILHDTGVEPALLELEVTETAAMRDVNFTIQVLHELRAMGVRIAMDDFGTGYSSLSYLKKFPLHTLKIDRSFVQDLADNPSDTAIVSAVITLGQGLNLSVVAEGVETQAQLEQLRSLNCVEMQGYWFSKPVDAQRTMQFLQQHYQRLSAQPLI